MYSYNKTLGGVYAEWVDVSIKSFCSDNRSFTLAYKLASGRLLLALKLPLGTPGI